MLLPRVRDGEYDLVGINITYAWQLPFALWIARLVRRCLPSAFVIAGGTEVAGTWKYSLDRATFAELFDDFDATVVGEGEAAYVAILESRRLGSLPEGEPNIHLHPKYGARRMLPVRYERLADLPVPDFSGIDWRQYLSPEPFVYYSPTSTSRWTCSRRPPSCASPSGRWKSGSTSAGARKSAWRSTGRRNAVSCCGAAAAWPSRLASSRGTSASSTSSSRAPLRPHSAAVRRPGPDAQDLR